MCAGRLRCVGGKVQNGNKRDREDSQEKEGLQCDYGACATAKEYIVYSFNFVFYSNVKINEAIIFLFFFFFTYSRMHTSQRCPCQQCVKFSICDSVAFLMTSLGNVITSRGMRTCGVQEK